MKRALLVGAALVALVAIEAYSQCQKTHYFCTSLLSDEQQKEYWNLNNQSKSAVFAKGKTYKMSFIAYKGFDYRISVCTDVEGGDKPRFELFHDAVVRVKDEFGNTNIKRQKETLYKNSDDNMSPMIEFTVEKTEKFYLDVQVPETGESKNRKLAKSTDNVCVGVLLEHKKVQATGF